MKPFIGLKQLWYGDVVTSAITTKAALSSWISSAKEVKNVHDGTWSYEQDDPDITDYVNELTGKPYYRDVNNNGNKTINFTLGEYEFEDRVALQGGSVSGGVWSAPKNYSIIYKSVLALTKTGNYVFFPRAAMTAKVDPQEKNLGLGITALAMDTADSDVVDEYWYDGDTFSDSTGD